LFFPAIFFGIHTEFHGFSLIFLTISSLFLAVPDCDSPSIRS